MPTACLPVLRSSLEDSMRQQFHMHLVSDATGETLNTVARAAAAYYSDHQPVEHIYALVRTSKQLERVASEISRQPGIVLFTLADPKLRQELEEHCRTLGAPCISILDPVIASLAAYLKTESRPHVGGQHALNAEYFRRIDAMNYTLLHDDGQHLDDLESADVVLIGVSRSSKTPTSIYLANRGIKTANVPIIPSLAVPPELDALKSPLTVGLVASAERISQIRRHRLLSLNQPDETAYADPETIAAELVHVRKLCARHRWPVIDVTRRSIEETAAAVLNLLAEKQAREQVVP